MAPKWLWGLPVEVRDRMGRLRWLVGGVPSWWLGRRRPRGTRDELVHSRRRARQELHGGHDVARPRRLRRPFRARRCTSGARSPLRRAGDRPTVPLVQPHQERRRARPRWWLGFWWAGRWPRRIPWRRTGLRRRTGMYPSGPGGPLAGMVLAPSQLFGSDGRFRCAGFDAGMSPDDFPDFAAEQEFTGGFSPQSPMGGGPFSTLDGACDAGGGGRPTPRAGWRSRRGRGTAGPRLPANVWRPCGLPRQQPLGAQRVPGDTTLARAPGTRPTPPRARPHPAVPRR
jgi:hypothetical protein